MKYLFLFLLGVFGASSNGFAQKFDLDGVTSVTIEAPPHWEILQKRMRTPLMFVGPDLKKSRFHSVVDIFTIESLPKELLDSEKFDGYIKIFEKGKRDWVAEKAGEFREIFPYAKLHWKNAQLVHQLKFSYELEGNGFTEESFYFLCDEIPMHAKALIPDADPLDKAESIVLSSLSGMSCSRKK